MFGPHETANIVVLVCTILVLIMFGMVHFMTVSSILRRTEDDRRVKLTDRLRALNATNDEIDRQFRRSTDMRKYAVIFSYLLAVFLLVAVFMPVHLSDSPVSVGMTSSAAVVYGAVVGIAFALFVRDIMWQLSLPNKRTPGPRRTTGSIGVVDSPEKRRDDATFAASSATS